MSRRAPRPPRLYFSLRSPYSWLAVRRLREQVPDFADRFDCVPYWDPDPRTEAALAARGGEFHYVQMSRAKHLYMLQDTKRLAGRSGVTMAWPVDVDCWWERPHLAWLLARGQGREWELYDALTEARWGRGEDICTADTVSAAAVEAGLDPCDVVVDEVSPGLLDEAVECLHQAYLDDVFGIPYLRWSRHRFWGLDRVDDFLDTWTGAAPTGTARPQDAEMPLRDVPAPLLAAERPYDVDTAGGCG